MTGTFEEYLTRMDPYVRSAMRKRTRPHPFLGRDDLSQEAKLALWKVWERYSPRKDTSWDTLGRIGSTAIHRALCSQIERLNNGKRGGTSQGTDHRWERAKWTEPPPVNVLSIDQPLPGGEGEPRTLGETIAAEEFEDIELNFATIELERLLGDVERQVLHEMLRPGLKMLLTTRHLRARAKRAPWSNLQPVALAVTLGIRKSRIDVAIARIRARVRSMLNGYDPLRVTPRMKEAIKNMEKEERMSGKRSEGGTALMSAEDLGLDEAAESFDASLAEDAPSIAKKGKDKAPKASKGKKAPAAGKKASKAKDKAPKGKAKEAPKGKAKAERKASKRTPKPTPPGYMAVGTEVTYLGTSKRAKDWLKKGMKGTIFGYIDKGKDGKYQCYGVRFGDKSTALALKHVKKAA